ncbi:hypothetical protein SAMN04487779_100667 [Belnapia rosea]|uniref:Uncharacterized protein n=2 Tax=Belnapia rosea TaxID=938405 RepID=A0A1G6TGM3_9PROT|nr:hypothetical protein SAMN04487779_100667 [Belnapia rosea]
MGQDSDVVRVAAALKSPGIRYRSFGNEPVRGTAHPQADVSNSFPLLGAAIEAAATEARSVPMPAEPSAPLAGGPPASFIPLPADYASRPSPGPVDLSYPVPAPAPAPRQAEAAPRPAPPQPDPSIAEAAPRPVASTPQPVPPRLPAGSAEAHQHLLQALAPPAVLPVPAFPPGAPPQATGGTLAALLGAAAQGVPQAPWPSPLPDSGLLPAAQVTLPLSEVMRLVATGSPSGKSPFAAFRIAGGRAGPQ